jgi:hypothetical protein
MQSEIQLVTQRTQKVLLLWQLDLLSSDDVEDWLNALVLQLESLGHLPDWFFTLLERGPARCRRMSSREFDFPWLPLDFSVRFCAELCHTDLEIPEELEGFTYWLICASHSEDGDDPAIALGHELEHLLMHCDQKDLALAQARDKLPSLKRRSEARVSALMSGADLTFGVTSSTVV